MLKTATDRADTVVGMLDEFVAEGDQRMLMAGTKTEATGHMERHRHLVCAEGQRSAVRNVPGVNS